MAKYSIPVKVTIHAKSDGEAAALTKKLGNLLTKHGRALLLTEGITLESVAVEPKITREP